MTPPATDIIARKLASLTGMSRDELADRWAAIFGCPPPRGVRRELLLQACAFHIQVKHCGGMTAETRRLLKKAMARVSAGMPTGNEEAAHGKASTLPPLALEDSAVSMLAAIQLPQALQPAPQPPERRALSPGARLLRDWQGTTHVVDVVEGGFLYDGSLHRSLSAIAKQITGAHWSGPRFFGL